MKKLALLAGILLISFISFSFADTRLDTAVTWMNSNGLTKFSNSTDFMASQGLRRDEAAKFFVQYAMSVLGRTPDTTKASCNFSDENQARPDLKVLIKQSCQLGLFQGYNGKFMPMAHLTNAQAITVLIRLIDGRKDETQGYFAQKYFDKAQELGIMAGLTLDSTENFERLATRGEVGILIYNAGNGTNDSGWTNTGTNHNSDITDTNTVNIENFAFEPKELTVNAGTTVTWKQKDSMFHKVISTNLFQSTDLNIGDTFTFTFTTTGEFNYYCMIHPFMTGKIIVR